MQSIFLIVLVSVHCLVASSTNTTTHHTGGGRCVLLAKPQWSGGDLPLPELTAGFEVRQVSNLQAYSLVLDFISHSSAFRKDWQGSTALPSSSNASCREVVGVVGELDSMSVSIIHKLASRTNLSVALLASSMPSTSLPVGNPSITDMNPLEHYIAGFVSFANELGWTRIGLISDDTNYNLLFAERLQRELLKNTERLIVPYFRVSRSSNLQPEVLSRFEEYATQIIVMLVSKKLQYSILSEAQGLNFKWPYYALISFDFVPRCQNTSNFDDVVALRNSLYMKSECGNEVGMVQDSITAVTLAQQQNISNTSFPGVCGIVELRGNRRLIDISIVRVRNGVDTVLANYSSENRALNVNRTILESYGVPHGRTLEVSLVSGATKSHIIVVSIVYILCNIITTLNLVLYICFRNEPEIKANSVTVSICMFVGCYLLLIFMPVHAYEYQVIEHTRLVGRFLCNGPSWVSVIGLPFSLIFSTLFVKMLRVYNIFFQPHSYKKKLFSNFALLVYILLLQIPNVIILLLWALVDPFTKVPVRIPTKSSILVYYPCDGRYTLVWVTVPMVHYMALIVALSVLAIKTSKIRYKHFSDTKTTNAYACLSVLVFSLTILYWYLFFSTGFYLSAGITLYTGHTVGTLLCQFILFLPKVLPPTKRWLVRNKVKSKHFSSPSFNLMW